jgi:hypothetical protein
MWDERRWSMRRFDIEQQIECRYVSCMKLLLTEQYKSFAVHERFCQPSLTDIVSRLASNVECIGARWGRHIFLPKYTHREIKMAINHFLRG